jgi:hypothetical protein
MSIDRQIPAFIFIIALIFIIFLSGCTNSSEVPQNNHAGLIIQQGDGSPIVKCINFHDDEITGEDLLQLSGIPFISDVTNPMGAKMCSINDQGCNFPAEKCFCQCGNSGPCTYWAYFVLNQDGDWVYAPVGAKGRIVHDGDVDAWAWLTRASKDDQSIHPTLPDLDFEMICGETISNP